MQLTHEGPSGVSMLKCTVKPGGSNNETLGWVWHNTFSRTTTFPTERHGRNTQAAPKYPGTQLFETFSVGKKLSKLAAGHRSSRRGVSTARPAIKVDQTPEPRNRQQFPHRFYGRSGNIRNGAWCRVRWCSALKYPPPSLFSFTVLARCVLNTDERRWKRTLLDLLVLWFSCHAQQPGSMNFHLEISFKFFLVYARQTFWAFSRSGPKTEHACSVRVTANLFSICSVAKICHKLALHCCLICDESAWEDA